MPLDRPATVRLIEAGTRTDAGVYVPGPATEYRVWLTRIDAPAERVESPDGTRTLSLGRFRLRWFRALADHDVGLEGQILIDGQTWILATIDEVDAVDVRTDQQRALRSRRRWLEVTAHRVTRS